MASVSTDIRFEGIPSHFQMRTRRESPAAGIELVTISLEAEVPSLPPSFRCLWTHPSVDIQAFWHPGANRDKGLKPDWTRGFTSRATSSAPVGCLLNVDGLNRLTFAVSDALNPLEVKVGVHEETGVFHHSITFFAEPSAPLSHYEVVLRMDHRSIPYYEALRDVQEWWTSFPGYEPAPVPDVAKRPMYSTWYSFHQELDDELVEEQCKLAKAMGCDAIIIDDGWQTADNQRGYAYCGDWEVTAEKISDMRRHVDHIHALGVAVILWYNVAFVGTKSRAWQRFNQRLLGTVDDLGAGVLDPRFPDVREFIIQTYERAIIDWDLDGLKLDFVDSFRVARIEDLQVGNGRDYASVPAAVDRLLSDVMSRLCAIKPNIMIEFRQSYIGPLMRHYGNLFRAGDCPNDAIENRVRTLDIRLLCGSTAAHADMLMWHENEPVESAALQILNILFSVPQISVRLDKIPTVHREMVRFWLAFWLEHRDVLMDGTIAPHHPEGLYPVVESWTADKHMVAVYQDTVVQVKKRMGVERWIVVNGTKRERVVLEVLDDLGELHIEVQNCRGFAESSTTIRLCRGLHAILVPPSGVATLRVQG